MKILIVDDETVSRTKLKAILEEFGDCGVAAGGFEAITEVKKALLEGDPFDLITMDINMPDVDGTEALYEIRKLENSAADASKSRARIIMVTAQNDRDSLITCVQAGCDDFVIKPFVPEQVINRLLALKIPEVEQSLQAKRQSDATEEKPRPSDKVAIGKEVLTLFKRGEISLPSPPGIYNRFKALVEKGADLSEMADLLKEDMGLSFHLISVSNSPMYRGVVENRNLVQAIGRLGLELTIRFVEILSNRSLFTVANNAYQPVMDNLWRHSVACANAAALLVEELKLELKHDPFTMGIMHDVGKMVLIQIVSELEARGKIGVETNRADLISTLAEYHGPFGEAVLDQWSFPKEYGLIAKNHHDLDRAAGASRSLRVIQLANLISKSIEPEYNGILDIDISESPPAVELGAGRECIESVRTRLMVILEETLKALE